MLFFWIEDNNMRIIFNAIVLSAASLCASIVFAENHARVDVPFSFVAKNSSFPAGPYDIMMDSSQSFITLASRTTSPKIIQMTLGPANPAKAPAVLKFYVVGPVHSLESIQMGARSTSNFIPRSKPSTRTTALSLAPLEGRR
jgi:hypothetical protein